MTTEQFQRGMNTVLELFPQRKELLPSFPIPKEIADDWNVFTCSAVMGDIWSRPGLPKTSRAMITIAALTVLDKPNQLKAYISAALNIGVSRQEICEIIMQMAAYGGVPAAIEALGVAHGVFALFDATPPES